MNFTEILNRYGIDHAAAGEHHHVSTGWIGIRTCPWCRASGYHLGVNLQHGYASCWRCGGHRLVDVLMKLTGEPYPACRKLLEGVEMPLARRLTPSDRPRRVKVPPDVKPLGVAHRAYLRRRGFDPDEVARLWGVAGIGLSSGLSWRLFIPIHHHGEVVSWTTRSIGDAPKLRYVSAAAGEEALPHKQLLYGADHVRHAAIICEGPTDVWRIGPGAVATMGTSVGTGQLLRLLDVPVRAVCFDPEPEARRRAQKLADELQGYPGETHVIELETGADVADATPEAIEEIRNRFL